MVGPYYEGTRWLCRAYFRDVRERVSELVETEAERDAFILKHVDANVDISRCYWQEQRISSAYYPAGRK